MTTQVIVQNGTRFRLQERQLSRWVDRVIRHEWNRYCRHPSQLEVLEIIHVGSSRMKELKKYFFGVNADTDIISLWTTPISGCFYINLSYLQKQAERFCQPLVHEWGYLCIHGLLHLAGWDHKKDESFDEPLFQVQRKIFRRWRGFLKTGWIERIKD